MRRFQRRCKPEVTSSSLVWSTTTLLLLLPPALFFLASASFLPLSLACLHIHPAATTTTTTTGGWARACPSSPSRGSRSLPTLFERTSRPPPCPMACVRASIDPSWALPGPRSPSEARPVLAPVRSSVRQPARDQVPPQDTQMGARAATSPSPFPSPTTARPKSLPFFLEGVSLPEEKGERGVGRG